MSRVDLRGELLEDGLETGAVSTPREEHRQAGHQRLHVRFLARAWLCRVVGLNVNEMGRQKMKLVP